MHTTVLVLTAASIAALLTGAAAAQEEKKPPIPATKLTAPPPASTPAQDDLKAKRAEKLAKPVFQKAAWHTDYDAARAEAKEHDKLLLVYFTRSYAP